MEGLVKVMDKEKWVAVAVPKWCVALVDSFHGAGETAEFPGEDSYKQLISDDIAYWCTESLLFVIASTCEYIQIVTEIRDVAYETFCSLVELIKVQLCFTLDFRHEIPPPHPRLRRNPAKVGKGSDGSARSPLLGGDEFPAGRVAAHKGEGGASIGGRKAGGSGQGD